MTTARLLRSRVSWKLSRTVLKPSRSGDAPAQAADRTALGVDLASAVSHTHANRYPFAFACVYVTWNIKLIICDPLPGRV